MVSKSLKGRSLFNFFGERIPFSNGRWEEIIIEQVSVRSESLDAVGIAKIIIASFLYKRWDKIAKIVRRETVHYFVKDNKFVFVASIL